MKINSPLRYVLYSLIISDGEITGKVIFSFTWKIFQLHISQNYKYCVSDSSNFDLTIPNFVLFLRLQ